MQLTPVPADGELKLVVALFRHGVRAPLQDFSLHAKEHSRENWPDLVNDWHVDCKTCWGDLTPQGARAAKALGACYASYYSQNSAWPNGFKAYLWADGEEERSRETAKALALGLQDQNITVEVYSSEGKIDPSQGKDSAKGKVDPLFHPFKAGCGTPDPRKLQPIVDDINTHCQDWLKGMKSDYNSPFNHLRQILACPDGTPGCTLLGVTCVPEFDDATTWSSGKVRSSPIIWKGVFAYGSGVSEAFLLEYANGMADNNVGWGRVKGSVKLGDVLRLHEFYFDKTQREPYLALTAGSNLVREILEQIDRKAGRKSPIGGQCPRATADSQFVGLVGHDTNLANVGSLLGLQWVFNDKALPPDTFNLPSNNALPAGALVFELRQRGGNYFVRIQYVTQSLSQMRQATTSEPRPSPTPYRLEVDCRDQNGKYSPCGDMSLDDFNTRVKNAIGDNNQFFSRCQTDGQQVCP
jgi:4-phytase/acid phosphatase